MFTPDFGSDLIPIKGCISRCVTLDGTIVFPRPLSAESPKKTFTYLCLDPSMPVLFFSSPVYFHHRFSIFLRGSTANSGRVLYQIPVACVHKRSKGFYDLRK